MPLRAVLMTQLPPCCRCESALWAIAKWEASLGEGVAVEVAWEESSEKSEKAEEANERAPASWEETVRQGERPSALWLLWDRDPYRAGGQEGREGGGVSIVKAIRERK